MINKARLIRRAQKVLRNIGSPEEAYTVISQAFSKENKTDVLDYQTAKAKLDELNAHNDTSKGTE